MKQTLLEMAQNLSRALETEEFNSISDTIEAMMLAQLIKEVYYDIANDLGLPEHETLIELNPSNDADQPVLMYVPNTVTRISSISYDVRGMNDDEVDLPNWRKLTYLPLNEFIAITQGYRSSDSTVDSMQVTDNGETFEFIYRNDTMPTYYTSFNDYMLIFDSYDNTIDTTLQKSKTMCYGARYKEFLLEDSFVPHLDPTQFPYFLNRCKVRAFAEHKQLPHQEAASEARRQKIITQKRKRRTPDLTPFQKRINYGR